MSTRSVHVAIWLDTALTAATKKVMEIYDGEDRPEGRVLGTYHRFNLILAAECSCVDYLCLDGLKIREQLRPQESQTATMCTTFLECSRRPVQA